MDNSNNDILGIKKILDTSNYEQDVVKKEIIKHLQDKNYSPNDKLNMLFIQIATIAFEVENIKEDIVKISNNDKKEKIDYLNFIKEVEKTNELFIESINKNTDDIIKKINNKINNLSEKIEITNSKLNALIELYENAIKEREWIIKKIF